MGVIACANAVFALALSRYVPVSSALVAGGLLYLVTLRRFMAQMHDQPRARWITRCFDEPLFVHFGASTLALLFSPLCALVALGLGVAWLARPRGVRVLAAERGLCIRARPTHVGVGNLD